LCQGACDSVTILFMFDRRLCVNVYNILYVLHSDSPGHVIITAMPPPFNGLASKFVQSMHADNGRN
jgi:hypothetical protein